MTMEEDRGKAKGYRQAYKEGFAAYDRTDTSNPYSEKTDENRGYDDGKEEAAKFFAPQDS